ncbi:mannitol-1-phosphate 5-dehydrogenase [Williamsoniiplasma somnilux]|uniref:Mannitol-1-phosphate 5-dehydrogenase n=1 Tax=Williamsoniiplasma somnilux TaxID=215578 RepID=A0A2K8P110_9MOLU|nr:hypothetical protein [Williamsoniiplasma somnilux]ATZ18691.1 mannitol-1-phosphate 5-dehydrogenase [Williamsoniiplasma somnilux]
MKTIHLGAGNIGRGFIAPILKQDPAIGEIKFLDVNPEVINLIKTQKKYIVKELAEKDNEILIKNISANLLDDILKAKIDDYLLDAKIITISIGQPNLRFLIKNFEYISDLLIKNNKEMLILCCENGNRVSSYFKKLLIENKINVLPFHFVDVVVDRIVPNQERDSLNVQVEKYFSWIVDEEQWPSNFTKIKTIVYSKDLDSEINKKICLLNGVHSALSWHRYAIDKFQIPILQDALKFNETKNYFDNLTSELVIIIAQQYNFEIKYLKEYISSIWKRFNNPKIKDEMSRIARNPITKMQKNERILNPLFFAASKGLKFEYLSQAFNDLLNYHFSEDKEAVELSNYISVHGKLKAVLNYVKELNNQEIEVIKKIIN